MEIKGQKITSTDIGSVGLSPISLVWTNANFCDVIVTVRLYIWIIWRKIKGLGNHDNLLF